MDESEDPQKLRVFVSWAWTIGLVMVAVVVRGRRGGGGGGGGREDKGEGEGGENVRVVAVTGSDVNGSSGSVERVGSGVESKDGRRMSCA